MMGKIIFDDDAENTIKQLIVVLTTSIKFHVKRLSDTMKELIRKSSTCRLWSKTNIIRCLLKRDVEVIRVPWNHDFTNLQYDGLFISNGPRIQIRDAAVQNIRKAMQNQNLPIFGICMGNQLLSKAGGASIYKLKYGHRSHNQPVRMVGTNRCFITKPESWLRS